MEFKRIPLSWRVIMVISTLNGVHVKQWQLTQKLPWSAEQFVAPMSEHTYSCRLPLMRFIFKSGGINKKINWDVWKICHHNNRKSWKRSWHLTEQHIFYASNCAMFSEMTSACSVLVFLMLIINITSNSLEYAKTSIYTLYYYIKHIM